MKINEYNAPRTRRWSYGQETCFMGKINAIDEQWHVYGCTHFNERSNERIIGGSERCSDILTSFLEDVLFCSEDVADYVCNNSDRLAACSAQLMRQRVQLIDRVNEVSFIIEVYPKVKEIFVLTVIPQKGNGWIKRKSGNIVVELYKPVEEYGKLRSKVEVLEWEDRQCRHFRVAKTKIDSSYMEYPIEMYI